MDKELAERIALFRFGVIAPLVDRRLSRGEQQRVLEEITSGTWEIPGSSRTTLGRSTVLKWLTRYRRSGGNIEALKPQCRSDKGNSRCIDTETEFALLELKDRGMSLDPKLAIADGALGFWKALPQVFPSTKGQRCWVHKTANILDKMPKKVQPRAKTLIHDIYMAETEKDANRAFNHFVEAYEDKYPRAVETLTKDREQLMAFYQFPAAYWKHIRSTNVIESVFSTVRLRTYKTKGMGTSKTTLAMAFKLIKEAEKSWRKITRRQQLELVREGRVFKDGELVSAEPAA